MGRRRESRHDTSTGLPVRTAEKTGVVDLGLCLYQYVNMPVPLVVSGYGIRGVFRERPVDESGRW